MLILVNPLRRDLVDSFESEVNRANRGIRRNGVVHPDLFALSEDVLGRFDGRRELDGTDSSWGRVDNRLATAAWSWYTRPNGVKVVRIVGGRLTGVASHTRTLNLGDMIQQNILVMKDAYPLLVHEKLFEVWERGLPIPGGEAFTNVLRDTPGDATTWGVLADWLDEAGEREDLVLLIRQAFIRPEAPSRLEVLREAGRSFLRAVRRMKSRIKASGEEQGVIEIYNGGVRYWPMEEMRKALELTKHPRKGEMALRRVVKDGFKSLEDLLKWMERDENPIDDGGDDWDEAPYQCQEIGESVSGSFFGLEVRHVRREIKV